MAISKEQLDVLIEISGAFENSGDPYEGVSGDFDGQGISCGVLQWNIGQGSLQPLVKAVGKPAVLSAMPVFGDEMWKACLAPLGSGLLIVRSWQSGAVLKASVKSELKRLMSSQPMRGQQDAAIRMVAGKAELMADTWITERGQKSRTMQDIAWFFDLVTQNSSLKGIGFSDVAAFKQAAGAGKAVDVICDWLASTTSKYAGMEDCHKNSHLWRAAAAEDEIDLLVLSYLRSQKATLQWRGDVLNRKGALAIRQGWVHKKKFDFTGIF